jgi:hypothetical protein
VGVSVGVVVGGTAVVVGVSVGVLVGGTDVFVGVSVGVLVGGTAVFVGVSVGVLVGTVVGVLVGVYGTHTLFRHRAPTQSVSVQHPPGGKQLPLQTNCPVGQHNSSP